jgi:hypothetical protein
LKITKNQVSRLVQPKGQAWVQIIKSLALENIHMINGHTQQVPNMVSVEQEKDLSMNLMLLGLGNMIINRLLETAKMVEERWEKGLKGEETQLILDLGLDIMTTMSSVRHQELRLVLLKGGCITMELLLVLVLMTLVINLFMVVQKWGQAKGETWVELKLQDLVPMIH